MYFSLFIYLSSDVSQYAHAARQLGAPGDKAIDTFPIDALFATLTNVNFDEKRIMEYVKLGNELKDKAKRMYGAAAKAKKVMPKQLPMSTVNWKNPLADYQKVGIKARQEKFGKAVAGVQEMIVYGLKGVAAYYEQYVLDCSRMFYYF